MNGGGAVVGVPLDLLGASGVVSVVPQMAPDFPNLSARWALGSGRLFQANGHCSIIRTCTCFTKILDSDTVCGFP